MNKFKRLTLAAIIGVLAISLSGCGYNIPSDMIAIHVGEGPFEAKKLKGDCIDPSQRAFWTNDTYVLLPTSEREWDATGQDGSDAGRMRAVTKDSVEMYVPLTVRFTLKTADCDLMKDFYTRYVRRYGAEFDADGNYNAEWITLLRKLVADPADATLDRIIQGYNWRAVWNDPATKTALEKDLNEALAGEGSLLEVTAKGDFFDGISVLVGKPEPVQPALAEAVALEQTNVAKAQSAEAQAKADTAKAQAELAVSKAEAAKKVAAIEGFRLQGMTAEQAVRAYNEAALIEKDGNPYQPTYIVGGLTGN